MFSSPHVHAEKRGCLGLLTLCRPAALNALTHPMVRALRATLERWVRDPAVTVIVIRGEGLRAFCAGGDIRALAEGGQEAACAFLADEYRLNAAIASCPKPYVALLHGVVMGGGAGLSVHGRYRVADASLAFAMPEASIGFLPDVGGSYFLPRLPDRIGLYLALTAARIGLADALALGLVTHAVAAVDFAALIDGLSAGEPVDSTISKFAAPAGAPDLKVYASRIAAAFAAPSVEMIFERLARDGGDFARATAAAMYANSPMALEIAFRLIREGASLPLGACLEQEFRVAVRALRTHDFREGVRAMLIDKDRAPRWQPVSLSALDDSALNAFFAPLDESELSFN